jgi:hypothetical protein
MRSRQSGRIAIAIVAAACSTACYAYQPLTRPTPDAGAEVRATLLTPASVQVGEITIQDVDRVEGLVYRANGDSLLVSGAWLYTRLGSRYAANGGVFSFDRPQLRVVEVRRLSPARTGLAAVLTVGLVAGLFAAVEQALGGSGPPPGGGDGH